MPTGEIRIHNLSRRAAVDLRLRPRGHWDPHTAWLETQIFISFCKFTLLTEMSAQFARCRGHSNDISCLLTDTDGLRHSIRCLSLADGYGKVGVGTTHYETYSRVFVRSLVGNSRRPCDRHACFFFIQIVNCKTSVFLHKQV